MIDLLKKYKDIVSYLFFGVCTTVINILIYYISAHLFHYSTLISTVVAWVGACLFAYFTNRKWVFHSTTKAKKDIFLEIISFFACRLATGFVDWIIMVVFVDFFHFNDIVIKVISNVIVIILNYVASKLVIFNKKDSKNKKNVNWQFILSFIILSLFVAYFIYDGINFIQYDFLSYDDAYNATVAANMFRYGKYMVSYPSNIVFYNMITTGPVVLLPTSLLYHLFGINSITSRIVPLIYGALDIIILYYIFILCLKKFRYKYVISSFMSILLCLSDSLFIYTSNHLIGESASLFFILLGILCLILFYDRLNNIYLFVFGGCLAVSFLTKSSMIFFAVSFFGLMFIEFLFKRISLKQLFLFFSGFLIFFIIFDLFKFIQLGGIIPYVHYWKDEIQNMFQQSSGIDVSVRFKDKFFYLNEIFQISPYISIIIVLVPIVIYLYVFFNSIFKNKEFKKFVSKYQELYSIILLGIAGDSLIAFFLLLGGNGLMYARRHIVNSFSVKITFIFIILYIIYFASFKLRKTGISRRVNKFVCVVIGIILLSTVFPMYHLKNNFVDMNQKSYHPDYRMVLMNELEETINKLDGEFVLYTAGWWQEPNITLDYPNVKMISIFDVAYNGYQLAGNDYFLVGSVIDNISTSDIENLLHIKLTRVNQNVIDYSQDLNRFNRMDFDLFSIYRIEKND